MRYETQADAAEAANEEINKMRHPGDWEIRIWNNRGWHWDLRHNSGLATRRPPTQDVPKP